MFDKEFDYSTLVYSIYKKWIMKHVGVTKRIKNYQKIASSIYVLHDSHSSAIIELLTKATTNTLWHIIRN